MGAGAWLDAWTPRLLKLAGIGGIILSMVLAAQGAFQPILFGGSLVAASGGYVGDALNSARTEFLKPPTPPASPTAPTPPTPPGSA
jgi:hypothetical protein